MFAGTTGRKIDLGAGIFTVSAKLFSKRRGGTGGLRSSRRKST